MWNRSEIELIAVCRMYFYFRQEQEEVSVVGCQWVEDEDCGVSTIRLVVERQLVSTKNAFKNRRKKKKQIQVGAIW